MKKTTRRSSATRSKTIPKGLKTKVARYNSKRKELLRLGQTYTTKQQALEKLESDIRSDVARINNRK